MKNILILLRDPKVILAIVLSLAGVFRKELGIDAYVSQTLADVIVGASLLALGYLSKETFLSNRATEILEPRIDRLLGDIEVYLEDRYQIEIPDSVKGEIVDLLFKEDTDGM